MFDTHSGHTLAILEDEHFLSDMPTAAAGSLGARVLAPEHVQIAAVLGAGTQAYWQAQALHRERSFGADDPTKCELDATALRRARVFVDSLEATAANGDVHRAMRSGSYALEDVSGEIGEVLADRKPGRVRSTDITIAKMVGIGVQDLVAAEVSLAKLGVRPR